MALPDVTLAQAIADWLEDKSLRANDKTLRLYRYNLMRFADNLFKLGVVLLRDVTPKNIRIFLHWLEHQRYKANTIHQSFRSVRTFLRWCVWQRYIDENPIEFVTSPTLPEPSPKAFNTDEIEMLIEHALGTRNPERDYALLIFAVDTGARRQEIVDLSVSDVDLVQRVVTIRRGKGSRLRRAPLSTIAAQIINQWLQVRDERCKTLFGLTASGVRQVMERAKRKLGFSVYAHRLRHTFATWYEGDIQDVSRILGHRDIRTTASTYRYRNVTPLVRVHDQRSPVSLFVKQNGQQLQLGGVSADHSITHSPPKGEVNG